MVHGISSEEMGFWVFCVDLKVVLPNCVTGNKKTQTIAVHAPTFFKWRLAIHDSHWDSLCSPLTHSLNIGDGCLIGTWLSSWLWWRSHKQKQSHLSETYLLLGMNKPQAGKRKYLLCLMLKHTIEKSNSGLGSKYVLGWRFGVREARSKLTFMQRLYEERRYTVSHFLVECQSRKRGCSVCVSAWVPLTIFEEQQGWSSSGAERDRRRIWGRPVADGSGGR